MLTQARLKELLHYNPDTGVFTRLVATSNFIKVGDIAGASHNRGYICISVHSKPYLAHRLAWLYMTGQFPSKQIDHVNGVRNDNRFINLRQCTQYENDQNRVSRKNTTSKYIGVSWNNERRKWRATININGKQKHLGRFETEEEALSAYIEAKAKIHTFNPVARAI